MEHTPTNRMSARARVVADALRKARDRHRISVRELARRANTSPSTVTRLENPGETIGSPSIDTLEALAAALNCSLAELLGEESQGQEWHPSEWPAALTEILDDRGAFASPAEHAFIQKTILEWRVGGEEELSDRSFWESELEAFQRSRSWGLIGRMVGESGYLDGQPKLMDALESVLDLSIIASEPAIHAGGSK